MPRENAQQRVPVARSLLEGVSADLLKSRSKLAAKGIELEDLRG